MTLRARPAAVRRPGLRSAAWVSVLLRWYRRNGRDLPWRGPRSRYAVWVSEIMLQQTQVETVIPYYRRFLRRFSSVRNLADAPLDDVLKLWEGLGYYARARNLHRAARELVERFRGRVPSSAAELRTLPGIGGYTAAAIASICGGEVLPSVDGNVLRVFSRFLRLQPGLSPSRRLRQVQEFLSRFIPSDTPGDFNQALMDLGATVCRPTAPRCPRCPLRLHCVTCRLGAKAPGRAAERRRPTPHWRVAVGIIHNDDALLIARRPPRRRLGGLWELPGGRPRPGEGLAECLRRVVKEETGVTIRVGRPLGIVRHAFSHVRLSLHAFEGSSLGGQLRPQGVEAVRWTPRRHLVRYAFSTGTRRVLALASWLASPS